MVAATTNSVYSIINDAMHDAGLLGEGDQPNSDQVAEYQRRIADIINLWQTQGLKLFLLQDIELTLTESQGTYVLKPSGGDVDMTAPTRILQAYVLDTNNIRRPINSLSWDEWLRLSQVTGNDGTINSYFVDRQATQMNLHFWQAPDATEAANTAHVLAQVFVPGPVNFEEDISFPQEWRIALRWGLADDICTGQPEAIMSRCAMRARAYREALENFEVENTETRFTPSNRAYRTGSFT